MIGFPFDSHVSYDSSGAPVYDRAISSEPLRKLLKTLLTTGIDPRDSTCLQVGAGSGMNVTVSAGFCIVEGCLKLSETTRTLAVQASDTTNDRIDTVVMRLNTNDNVRECDLYVLKGTPASSPVHPSLTRTSSVYEIGLADIFVGANSTSIATYKITDTRYNEERCGVLAPIDEIDTETLDQQMNSWATEQQEEFEEWVETIKDILDESTAGHLQNEIDAINSSLEDVPVLDDGEEDADVQARDADTLGGLYSASDITAINDSLVYSTSEKPIGTWIDGKTIYRKVIIGNFASEISDGICAVSSVSVEDLNIDTPIRAYGADVDFTHKTIPTYWSVGTSNYINSISLAKKSVQFSSNRSSFAGKSCYAVIEYTKTTE